jgi:hypothetical protein
MLFKVLKLFGLDVPARIDALKASFDQRVEQATEHVKEVAQKAAVVAALSAFATVAGAMAMGVGFIALYRWVAEYYGVYAGLGLVGAILVMTAVILGAMAVIKGKSLAPNAIKLPLYSVTTANTAPDASVVTYPTANPAAIPLAPATPTGDLVEPLAFFLSKIVKHPTIGNPVLDELIGNLRASAHGTADEAIDRAANVIRNGDRANLVVVLSGAAMIGWLLARHTRQ